MRRTVTGAGLACLVIAGALGMRAAAGARSRTSIESAEPYVLPVTLTSAARAALARHQGEVVLLEVWATWCGNCEEGLRDLDSLQPAYGARGLRIVALSVDRELSAPAVRAWANARGVRVEVAHDPTGESEAMLGRPGVPLAVLVDRRGRVREARFGHSPLRSDGGWLGPWLRGRLETLLAEPGRITGARSS